MSTSSARSARLRFLTIPAAAAIAMTGVAIGPIVLPVSDSYAATVSARAASTAPWLSFEARRTASGAPRIKVLSNAHKVKLKITGNGRSATLTAKTNKTIKLPSFAKKVRVKTLATKHLRPSGWHTVKIPARPTNAGNSGSAFEREVFTLTNQARTTARTCGSKRFSAAPALTWSDQLAAAALGHSQDMAAKNYFDHNSKDGRTPWDRIEATGYRFSTAGENIAAGQQTPSSVVTAWLNSPGHCENIMNSSFTQLGVGYATGGSYGKYWTQDFARPA